MIDLTGKKFGRLLVLGESDRVRNSCGFTVRQWMCKCDCGNVIICNTENLKSGNTKSCGCLRTDLLRERSRKHGMTGTKLYRIWSEMNNRCSCETNKAYKNYGARGISVCSSWRYDFISFHDWAMSNGYKEGLSIERVDNNGNYCLDNCKWIPRSEQQRNRRNCHYITYKGQTKTLSEWSREFNIDRECLRNKEKLLGSGELAIEALLNSQRHIRRCRT